MKQQLKFCVTPQQALQFKELGINQDSTPFVWGYKKAPATSGNDAYFHLLFFRNQDGTLMYLCPEHEYSAEMNIGGKIELDDHAAAFTADHLATMLDMHLGDIQHENDGRLLNQNTLLPTTYSNLVQAMADRILINLTIGEYSRFTLNELLAENNQF